jgi:hypothetical protein
VHLLLQTRVKTLNCELGSVLKRWYPDMEVIAMLSTSPWGLSFLRRMEYHGSCKGPLCARRHRAGTGPARRRYARSVLPCP